MSIFKDLKQLFYKHLASSNNDKFGDTDIIVQYFIGAIIRKLGTDLFFN